MKSCIRHPTLVLSAAAISAAAAISSAQASGWLPSALLSRLTGQTGQQFPVATAPAGSGPAAVYAVAEDRALGTNMHRGLIDAALIQREVPDYKDRVFYISGPRAMVLRFRRVLKELGVARSRIRVDFFPGFA